MVDSRQTQPQAHPGRNRALAILKKVGSFFYTILCFIVGLVYRIIKTSKVAAVVILVVIVVLIGLFIDGSTTANKIYGGISIGEVDVSNMTKDEALEAISDHYESNLEDTGIVIFADEDVANSADLRRQLIQYEVLAEQISFEEAQESKILWLEDAQSLGAYIPYESLVSQAFDYGRGISNFFDRVSASMSGHNIEVKVDFDEDDIETLAGDIDATLGNPRIDYGIDIDDGEASVTEGNDGYEVNRGWLEDTLSQDFLSDADEETIVVESSYAPLRITEQQAQDVADEINQLIKGGATFVFDDVSLDVSNETLGDWVATRVEETDDGFELVPYIDDTVATPSLVSMINKEVTGNEVAVSFSVDNDVISVTPQGEVTVPLLAEALDTLDRDLFGSLGEGGIDDSFETPRIEIMTKQVSGTMSFEDAFSYGIITAISTFTTEFVNTSSTANRAQNIQHAADLLNKSIAPANGGTWSFNDIAGDCNEEAGFLTAGAIAGGEHVEDAGGGICQVATTVFNAVYEAGYCVVERTNHSLYVSSYPAGRDAAIAYPDLNLVWRNDTASDVLLLTSYTDTSITVTLYGVDPGYTVRTETGDWIEGEKHSSTTVIDETLSSGTSYIETVGTDGMQITVYRTVLDKNGNTIYDDVFDSEYDPVTEVIVEGP